jgi:hypothetical protein
LPFQFFVCGIEENKTKRGSIRGSEIKTCGRIEGGGGRGLRRFKGRRGMFGWKIKKTMAMRIEKREAGETRAKCSSSPSGRTYGFSFFNILLLLLFFFHLPQSIRRPLAHSMVMEHLGVLFGWIAGGGLTQQQHQQK